MAVDDETFYNVFGEEISRSLLVQLMIDYYNKKLEIGETKVTDFNEGSEIRNLLESMVVDCYYMLEDQNNLSQIAFIETAEGEWLDKHGANPFINLPRDEGIEASGQVEFKLPYYAETEIEIPDGTIVISEDNSLEYETQNTAIIGVGENSTTAYVICLTVGEDGNCPIGSINTIDDSTIDIEGLTVSNLEPITNGTDYEDDEDYRERLLEYLRQDDFGSFPYYIELGQEVDGVHDINLIDDESYTKKVIVNGYEKPVSEEVLLDVTEEFTDVSKIVVGHNFLIAPVNYKNVNLNIEIDVSEELDYDDIKLPFYSLFDGTIGYVGLDYDGLSIGEVLRKEQIETILMDIEGVENIVSIKNGEYDFDIIDATTVLDPNAEKTVLKLDSLNITQNRVD